MNSKNYFFSLLLTFLYLPSLNYAQQNTFNKDEELRKFVERGGKSEEVASNVYKLTYIDDISRIYNLNHKENTINNNGTVDTTIINVWEIDTTLYAGKFTFWQKVEVANSWWAPLPVEDLNRNNRPELYGYTDYPELPYPSGGPVRIFERDTDGIFKCIFEYDSSTLSVKALGDIHRTGGKEIYMHSKLINNGVVYRSDTIGVLPTTFDFNFYYNANQVNDMTFGDFDKNNVTDCAFVDGAGAQHCIIGEYRDSINNFEQLFQYSTTDEGDLSGFAINDFDQDGKTELVVGSGRHGYIYVIENIASNEYSLIDQFSFPFPNAYMKTTTNDIDENGRPEFWIGGQDFEEGITLYQCYESIGNNTYQAVARIELRYSVAFNTHCIQAVDIDNDGKEEIVISSGNNIFILKFDGTPGKHSYKLFYVKLGEATQPVAQFYPCAIADLDGDSKKDILIPFRKYQEPITYAFSFILRQDTVTTVNENEIKEPYKFNLDQNFPNPFNPVTKIKYNIPLVGTRDRVSVQLKVYDVLGNEIATLVNEEKPAGTYEVEFSVGQDSSPDIASGIYFYQLQATPNGGQSGSFVVTKKMILLK